jgi:hypothetical protein
MTATRLISVGGIIAAIALAGWGCSSEADLRGPSNQASQPMPSVSALQARHFGVLRRGQVPADGLTRVARATASSPPVSVARPNLDLARRAATPGTGKATWIIPAADDQICEVTQIDDRAGGGCVPLDVAEAGRYVSTTSVQATPGGPETIIVVGLVPDGTTDAVITTSRGKTLTARVHDNVYVSQLDDGSSPQQASFETPDGKVHAQVHFLPAEGAPRAGG